MLALSFVIKHTRAVCRLKRYGFSVSLCQMNRRSAFHRHLPDSSRAFGVEINPMTIRRPERIASIGCPCGEAFRRASLHVHHIEFCVAGSSRVEDDALAVG